MSIGAFIAIALLCLMCALPVGTSFALTSLMPKLVDPSFAFTFDAALRGQVTGLDSFPLMAVPLFMLSGVIMARGISEKIFNFFAYFIGNKTAGFPCCVVLTCLFYGAISGSGVATTAAVGSMAIPFLISMGYDPIFSTALVAISGGLGVIIPPSIPFVIYSATVQTSVSDMFVGGVIPGILIGICLMLFAYIYCKRHGEDKERLHKNYEEIRAKGFWNLFKESFWALLTPVIILGSIYGGIASPTEAASVSIYYALFVSIFIYKTVKVRDIPSILRDGINTYAAVLFIIAAAIAFSRVVALMNVATAIANGVLSVINSKFLILLLINIILLICGMLMDTVPIILIMAPMMAPIATGIGMNLTHFGIILVCNLAIGFVTPPMGINLFAASNMTGIPVASLAKKAIPMIAFFMIACILINAFPQLTLFLVNLSHK